MGRGRRGRVLRGPGFWFDYDVSPDGQAFLVLALVNEGPDALVAVEWDAEVRRQLRDTYGP